MPMSRLILFACIMTLVSALAGNGSARADSKVSEKQFAAAINLAGRQRMLTQKMTKEFLLTALKVDEGENKKNCDTTARLFAESLDRLLQGDAELNIPGPPTPEINEQLKKVKALWDAFSPKLAAASSGNISRDALVAVAQLNVPLLEEMNKAVVLYESESAKGGAKGLGAVVNIAGRQRMLSQKIAKEILLIALGVDPDANRRSLQATKDLFQQSLAGLIQGNEQMSLSAPKTPTLLAQMKKVESLWNDFIPLVDQAIGNPEVSADLISKVGQLNLKLLQEMNRAVTMYEAEGK
jgi:nitrate/nitrite-specific signal transduction histidine kinase